MVHYALRYRLRPNHSNRSPWREIHLRNKVARPALPDTPTLQALNIGNVLFLVTFIRARYFSQNNRVHTQHLLSKFENKIGRYFLDIEARGKHTSVCLLLEKRDIR